MSFAAWTLAIDFGTSNSAAAHSGATSGAIETLALSHAGNLMSSSVFVAAPDRIIVGDAAVDAAQQNPAAFVASPKRLIGADPTCTVNGHIMPTHVLVSAVMGAIVQRGKAAHAGAPPAQLVLTHPEAWAHQQIRVLIDAAAAVGIHPSTITTISEPRAAAAHYSRSHAMQPGAKIAVFDFGGGTLDIAALTVTADGAFEVIAARGDNGLGGKNLDALVQRWVEERLGERDPDLVAWLRREAPVDVLQALHDSVRRGKELLSEAPSATITVPTPAGRTTLQITRDEFDELIGRAVDQAMQLTRATLLDAGITHAGQLTALYLTGGSSRIPLIQQRLGDLGLVATLDDPKTVVAQGALLTARAEAAPRGNPASGWPAPPHPPTRGPGQPAPVRAPEFTTPPGGSPQRRRRWGRIAAVAVAVVAVVGIAVGTIALVNSGGDDPPVGAAAQSSASDTATDAAGGPTGVVTDEDQLMGLLPGPLRASVTDCRKQGFSSNDALKVMCRFAETSSLAELAGPEPLSYFMVVYADPAEAKERIVNIRNGVYSAGKGTLVEDPQRTAAAEVRPQSSVSGDYIVDYASEATALIVNVFGVGSEAEGRTFLSRSGLIA